MKRQGNPICPLNIEHGTMEMLHINQHLTGKKIIKNNQTLNIDLEGIPTFICLKCRENGRITNIIPENIKRSLDKNILSKIIPMLEKGFTELDFDESVPTVKITFSKNINKSKRNNQTEDEFRKSDMLLPIKPKRTFTDIVLTSNTYRQLQLTLMLLRNKTLIFEKWGLSKLFPEGNCVSVNFSGPSGTGKTITAEAVANELNMQLLLVNYAYLESKYVGDTPKNISQAFTIAKQTNSVLFFDEADSFLGRRLTSISQSSDYAVNVSRSQLLLELDKFTGIVIFATNLRENYDSAFDRRIMNHVEFETPNESCRFDLWKKLLPIEIPLDSDVDLKFLAQDEITGGLTGADIRSVIIYASTMAVDTQNNNKKITRKHFIDAIQHLRKSKTQKKESSPLEKAISKSPISKPIVKK